MSLWDRLVEPVLTWGLMRLELSARYRMRRAIERERADARSKVRLLLAVLVIVVLPSSFLFAAGFPGWLVWPYFGLAFGVVAFFCLVARYYTLYLSMYPDLFWPHLPPPKKPAETQVVNITADLEDAVWREWIDRTRRSGRAGEILAAVLRAMRPLVGLHVPRDPKQPETRS